MLLTVVMAVAAAQLLACALFSALSKSRFPKQGMRKPEKMLLVSAALAAVGSLALVDYGSLWKGSSKINAASVNATPSRGSCASVEPGMSKEQVTSRLGEPDETRSDEETRGPGAAMLIYNGSKCVVHVFDGKVEFVD